MTILEWCTGLTSRVPSIDVLSARDFWSLDIEAVTATWNELSCYLPAGSMAPLTMWNTTTPQPSYNQMVTFQLLSLRSRHLQQPWPSGNAMPKDSKGIRWFLLVSHIIGHPLDSGLTLKIFFWLYKSFSKYVSRLLWCFLLYQPSWSRSFARCRCRRTRRNISWNAFTWQCVLSVTIFSPDLQTLITAIEYCKNILHNTM